MTQILVFARALAATIAQWPRWLQIAVVALLVWGGTLFLMYRRGISHEQVIMRQAKVAADQRITTALRKDADAFSATLDSVEKDRVRLLRKSDSLLSHRPDPKLIRIVDSTHVTVHDTVAVVPAEITHRIASDASLLVVKDSVIHVDSVALAKKDTLLAKKAAIIARQDTTIADQSTVAPGPSRPSMRAVAKIATAGYLVFRVAEYLIRRH